MNVERVELEATLPSHSPRPGLARRVQRLLRPEVREARSARERRSPGRDTSVLVADSSTAPQGWDAYVTGHPLASAYHRAAAVEIGHRAFGLRTTYFIARNRSGQTIGVLPTVEQSSAVFGRFLVSLPFVTYGGILADREAVATCLARRAAGHARQRRLDHVELRHTEALPCPGLSERLDKVSMMLPLPASEAALNKQLGSKLRSQIRRAEREQLDIQWGGQERIPDFYSVFARGMRDLGTPVYARRFFDVAYEALQSVASVLVVRARGEVQSAAIVVRHGRTLEVPWAAATPVAKHLAINMRMYWEMLRFGVASGAETFDFGRSSPDSGTYKFKAQWGAKPVQLRWHYWLPAGAPIPKLNQSNPKFARAAALWRRMPLWCANFLGPHIARSLP
jgi:serine/alanine adding enzyme